jgi:phosphonate transport system permease protein
MATLESRRDPLAARRLTLSLLFALLAWPVLKTAEFNPSALFDPGNLKVTGQFLAAILPPQTSADFLTELFKATLETLAIATAGMSLAMLIAVPLAYRISRVCRDHPSLQWLTRGLLTVLRGVPELVWALLFVRVMGLGPAAGVLALGLTYGGMLAKVYAEILESVDPTPARALLDAGASRPVAMLYGVLPLAAKELTSYTVYRWECALRASVVMGFVGAGGLGQLMDQAMKMLNGGEACAVLMVFLSLVLLADGLSVWLRQSLDAPAPRQASPFGWRSQLFSLTVLISVISSFALLSIDFSELLTVQAGQSMVHFATGFFPADMSAEVLVKTAYGIWQTLAVSILGTALAAVAGLLLALGKPRVMVNAVFNLCRSVPELVWASLTVLAVGLGPFAGALALALHTTGVLGRLFAQAIENAPRAPALALEHAGVARGLSFVYATLPQIAPQLLAYTLYRWEMNIRMAAILGFVGAGGLGQMLYVALSLMDYPQACTLIMAMLLLSMLVDQASARLRRSMD